jgi:hypothetical protein
MQFELESVWEENVVRFKGEFSDKEFIDTKLSALERAKLKSVASSGHATAADWLAVLEMIYRRYEEQNVVTTKDNP